MFYHKAVRPILDSNFPNTQHSAGLLGPGSEILGFDTERSTDHHWGPRLQLFLSDDAFATHAKRIDDVLRESLPTRFLGYSTSFGPPDQTGVRLLRDVESTPINHLVELTTVRSFFETILGIDIANQMRVVDWLTIPEQALLSVAAGRVYHDGLHSLNEIRQNLSYYPRDVWLYLLSAQWAKIAAEEAFVGRTGELGDELGSRIIATRLLAEMMKLCFLMERQYTPYNKWFGTAFRKLKCSKKFSPILKKIVSLNSWRMREDAMSRAYSFVVEMHNALGITQALDTKVSAYYNRPYQVIHARRFADEIRKKIEDPEVLKLKVPIGSIDQFIDNADILSQPKLFRRLATIIGE